MESSTQRMAVTPDIKRFGTSPSSVQGIFERSAIDVAGSNSGEEEDERGEEDETERNSQEVGLETIREPPIYNDLSIHSHAQRGDTASIAAMIRENPSMDISIRDSQGVTPLHWAAINAHIGTCRFLLDNGAEVDAIGGELRATPLQWAARNGHLYVIYLLISRGADPNIHDSQGFNTLHLIAHSSSVMPLLYMLHQPVAIDGKDQDGHTALMWAAYQGDALSVDLLIRHGASVNTTDNAGMTPLHWAAVKGNKVSIRHLVEAGANLHAKEESGKTPRDMAEELKGLAPFEKGLEEAGWTVEGRKVEGKFNPRNTELAIFVLPAVGLAMIFKTFDWLPIYLAIPLAIGEFAAIQYTIVYTLLGHIKTQDKISASNYFASLIIASILCVGWCWLSRLLLGTPGHATSNLSFGVMIAGCAWSLYTAIVSDPGFVPKGEKDAEIKEVLEELVDAGRLNGTNFCIICMAKKPLRSKHCRTCERCVAKFDHHCPWIWNCVGTNNHRSFVLFVLFLIGGILLFNKLTIAYILENAPEYIQSPSPGLTFCDMSTTLCRAGSYDPFLLATALWATLQLTWTFVLAISHLWQISRQMTTFEVSNLGRYGFMGGRGGQSLRDQSGAMKRVASIGASIGMEGVVSEPSGSTFGENEAEENVLLPQVGGHVHGPQCRHGAHGHGQQNIILHICGHLWTMLTGPLLNVLGLDRFTRGQALGGMRRAGRDQNPFDMGMLKNCSDFWFPDDDIDYTRFYEIPPEGWRTYRRKLAMGKSMAKEGGRGAYEAVSGQEV
ncbi:palmitoyltransferase AKR1 [Cryptococcus depauperatus]|nr:palmitoyltransferase AKR1 [Cryptococcus depauperatus CBS 7855]